MKRVREQLKINEIHQKGIRGKGIAVAVLDSGIVPHPDLKKHVTGFQDFVGGQKKPYDDFGHGTHVSGIIGGDGTYSFGRFQGIAPEVQLVSLKVLNQKGRGNLRNVLEGIQWIIDNGIRYGIRIVNLSFGATYTGSREDQHLIEGVEELWKLGYIVVASAGNHGPGKNTVAVPGCSEHIITVGAEDDQLGGYVDGSYRKHYSGRGNPLGNVTKPDVVAPAHQIISCSGDYTKNQYYTAKTGTSMATPIVSGVLALMLQVHPFLNNYECKRIIKDTAIDLGRDRLQQGRGMICPEKMMESLAKMHFNLLEGKSQY